MLVLLPVYARHIRGGELSYKYIGPGASPNSSQYLIRLKLYIDCSANDPGQNETTAAFTIFNRTDNSQVSSIIANKVNEETISYDPASNPCITNPPLDICYKLKYFETTIELPDNAVGYTISYQRCCRIEGIKNISGNSGNYGATYTCDIPGTNVLALPRHNSSPVIAGNDAVAICAGSGFSFDFSATDPEGDSLVYSLCDAYRGGGTGTQSSGTCLNCVSPNPAAPPPYVALPYESPYSGANPLGLKASINPATGIISGIAPSVSAQYVITSCIYEYHNGVLINIHRKDIHLKVSDCNPLKAFLKPDYDYCDDFLVSFKNEQTNPAGTVYIWSFGDATKTDTSLDPLGLVQHQFADTGTYTIKLKVILAGQCLDSTSTLARVYPGFYPGFRIAGSCLLTPLQFIDTTKTKYGVVNAWRWNFGDETTEADTAKTQNPVWKYASLGIKTAELIVQSNKGCIDTVTVPVEVKDKPTIDLAFKDTLICSNLPLQDTLLLQATGTGNFSWSPLTRIVNENTATPLVFPTNTTLYQVQLNQDGCINTDTVRVRVVDHVTLDAGPDSTICLTDQITLHPSGNALAYSWTPVTGLNNANIANPQVRPTGNTVFHLVGRIGKCSVADDVSISTVPYPGADAGADQHICFGDTALLQGKIVGSSFTWTPNFSLLNANSLSPLATPRTSTAYVLAVYDNLGCPKPGLDTVVISVRAPIFASAGKDTVATINQPLKLTGSGAPLFLWTPPDFLDNNTLQSPTALFPTSGEYSYAMKTYTTENCFAIDTIHIKVYRTAPDIFVPNAFTPGGTQNTVFRPIPVGISKINYFRVYNRWGVMVFSSNDGTGWNGYYGGKEQASGSYVWVVQGQDFTGKTITKKGVMVLVR
ncbi:MAG TPA: PKD domain-containing protein [Chitinophagaceae bacterium]|nr:PKD domain-containing protein [Chitinophagaceae bacterium]